MGRRKAEVNYLFDAAVDIKGFLLELSFFIYTTTLWLDPLLLVFSVHTAFPLFLGVESDVQDDGKASLNPMLQK